MEKLWAPWRLEYIRNGMDGDCFLCRIFEEKTDRDNLLLKRAGHCAIVMNRYPYTNGHTMVVPYTHVASLEDLSEEILYEIILLTQKTLLVLRQTYQTNGFNIGSNIGEAAGAGVKEHVHMHIVPRWHGDTNFMATTAETRVLPEDLEVTYQKLKERWQADPP